MDAYLPLPDTVARHVSNPADDCPWNAISGTQTLFWYSEPRGAENATYTSVLEHKPITFFVLHDPAGPGLLRLRSFRNWADGWDGEGARGPDPDVVDSASKIYGLLSLAAVPEVALSATGDPMFIYGGALSGEVVVTGIDTIDYFFESSAAPEDEDVDVSGGLPEILVDYIRTSAAG